MTEREIENHIGLEKVRNVLDRGLIEIFELMRLENW